MIVKANIDLDAIINSLDVAGLQWVKARAERALREALGEFADIELTVNEKTTFFTKGNLATLKCIRDRLGVDTSIAKLILENNLKK